MVQLRNDLLLLPLLHGSLQLHSLRLTPSRVQPVWFGCAGTKVNPSRKALGHSLPD